MELKRAVKDVVGRVCQSAILRPYVRKAALGSINVVYYHYVGPAAPHYQAFYAGCTISKFEQDLKQLGQVFDFAPLDAVLGSPAAGANGHKPQMAITFDDGLRLPDQVQEILGSY